MSHKSESQWSDVGTCDCGATVYKMGSRCRCDCYCDTLDAMEDLTDQINRSTEKVNAIRQRMKGKSLDEVILELRTEANYNNEVYRKGLI